MDTVQAWRSLNLADYANVENVSAFNPGSLARGDMGDNVVSGGGYSQQLYGGGGGQDVLFGGGGPDVFVVIKGQGNDVIQDFTPADGDLIRLTAGFTSFSQLQPHLSQVGADVKIDLGGGDGLMLRNMTVSQLGAQNFQLQFDKTLLGKPTFDEEFNTPLSLWDATSNPTGTWRPDYGSDPQSIYDYNVNNEMQVYVSPYFRDHPGDFSINPFTSNANGTLTITAAPSDNPEIFGKTYTSGLIANAPVFSQTYGYFEMRANPPETPGSWSAFWLAPSDGSWPPEADVMETWGAQAGSSLTAWHSNAGGVMSTENQNQLVPDTPDGFHTYGFLWTPHNLIWYIDGTEVYRADTPADMNKPMYVIANLALTNKDGTIGDGPIHFDIDYIRAYALPASIASNVEISQASYTLAPDEANLTLIASAHQSGVGNVLDNLMTSNDYGSTLSGGAGADTLVGGRGGDVLTGGDGADVFSFKALPWAHATVTDFVVGTDKLDLSALFSASGYTGNNPVHDGYLTLTSDGAGGTAVYYDPDGPGAATPWPAYVVDLVGVDPATASATLLAGNYVDTTAAPPPASTGTGSNSTPSSSYTFTATDQNMTLAGSGAQSVTGNGLDNVITSNDSGSTLSGGAGADTLVAGRGGDVLTGGDGADVFSFKILPWAHATVTDFVVGTDKLDLSALFSASGYAGNDPVHDGYLSLSSDGAGGTKVYYDADGPGAATPWPAYVVDLVGVSPTTASATLLAGAYVDTAPAPAPPSTGSGSGTGAAPSSSYTFTATDQNMTLAGSSAQSVTGNGLDNVITSNDGGSTLSGGAGADTLVAGRGGDVLTGGDGADVFRFKILPWAHATVTDFVVGTDKLDLSALFSASGYAGNDPVHDGYLSLSSDGAGGTKVYYDADGPGAATPWPAYVVDLVGVSPTTASATLLAGAYVDTAPAPPPASTGSGSAPPSSYTFTATDHDMTLAGSGAQSVTGNGLDNVIISNDGGSTLSGGAGADTLVAGRGGDVLTGGDGADMFSFQALPWANAKITDFVVGTDKLDLSALFKASGYTGADPVHDGYLSLSSDGAGGTKVYYDADGPGTATPWPAYVVDLVGVSPTTSASTLLGTASTSPPAPAPVAPASVPSLPVSATPTGTVTGTVGAETLQGGPGADLLDGKGGGDSLAGGAGDDTYIVSASGDVVSESQNAGVDTVQTGLAAYTLTSDVENLKLTSTTSAQSGTGNSLGNIIWSNDLSSAGSSLDGKGGDDRLVAGRGGDTLSGGAGSDIFEYDQAPSHGGEITDYAVGQDVIDLRGMFNAISYAGTDPLADHHLELRAVSAGTAVYFDADGVGAGASVLVTQIDNVAPTTLRAQVDWIFH